MTSLAISNTTPDTIRADAVVVPVAEGPDGPTLLPGSEALDAAFGGRLAAELAALGSTGATAEVTRLATAGRSTAPVVVGVGVGRSRDGRSGDTGAGGSPLEALRRAAGTAVRALAGTRRVALAFGDGPGRVRAVAEGALLGAYTFRRHKGLGDVAREAVAQLVVVSAEPGARREARRAGVVTEAVALARDLVNTMPGELSPDRFAEIAVAEAAAAGVDVEVLDERALARGGFGGLTGVGQGSSRPPRLVRLEWAPPRARTSVALVGKGITFDSGGLSLKPPAAMEWMKVDMGGAAAVFAAVIAAARLRLPVRVTGWLALAENMPSGTAIRPGDVLTMYRGRTVEVLNTDAEGRLVLADTIGRAGEEKPDLIVDVATLTGAALVSLGTRVFAVMGTDDARGRVVAAADAAGEQAWPIPLLDDLRPSLDSEVADLANVGERFGGMIVAGLFLREFVPEDTPWAHLDIAGPAWNAGEARDYETPGGTGSPVRTLVELLERA